MHIKLVNKYYQKHKERLWKETRERHQNLSEEKKDKKQKKKESKIAKSPWRKKQKLCEYMKKYYLPQKKVTVRSC